MSYQTIKQPNGKLAVWSTVIDDFIAENLDVDGVIEVYRLKFAWRNLSGEERSRKVQEFITEASSGIREMVENVAKGKPREGDLTYKEALAWLIDR